MLALSGYGLSSPIDSQSPEALAVGRLLDRLAFLCLFAFVFAIPWEESVPLLGGFVISRWLGLLAMITTALRVVASREYRKTSPLHKWIAAWMGWAVLSLFWTLDWDATMVRAGTYLQLLAAVWLIWELGVSESRIIALLQAYVGGTVMLAAVTIYNWFLGITASDLARRAGNVRASQSLRFTAEGVNANDLGMMLALSLPIAFYMVAKRPRSSWASLAQAGLCAVALLLSGSRGSFIAALAGLILFPIALRYLPAPKAWLAAGAFVAAAAAGVAILPQETVLRFLAIGTEITEGTLTHRTTLWMAGLNAFRDHPFVGAGAGAYASITARAVSRALVAHNTFVSVLVELGIVGAALLAMILALMVYCAGRMPRLERSFWLTVLLTWAIGVSDLTWEYRKPTWFLFAALVAQAYLPHRSRHLLRRLWRPVLPQRSAAAASVQVIPAAPRVYGT
jgi:O-antigen ligase